MAPHGHAEAAIVSSIPTLDAAYLPPDGGDTGSILIDTELRCGEPALRALLDYWHRARGARRMPARGDLRPADLPRLLPHLFLIDVEAEPLRLRYRLLGTALTEAVGRDSTGRYCDEIYPPPAMAEIERSYRWIMAHRAPVRTPGRAIHNELGFYDYEMLHLPLSPDDERVNMTLGALYFSVRA